jgi:hypothetical protein
MKQNASKVYVYAHKTVCLQSDLNTKPLNQNVYEQQTIEK